MIPIPFPVYSRHRHRRWRRYANAHTQGKQAENRRVFVISLEKCVCNSLREKRSVSIAFVVGQFLLDREKSTVAAACSGWSALVFPIQSNPILAVAILFSAEPRAAFLSCFWSLRARR